MVRTELAATKDFAERIDAFEAASKESLHLILGAGDEVNSGRVFQLEGIEMELKTRRRDGDRRFDPREIRARRKNNGSSG